MRISDWSADVCSSDLRLFLAQQALKPARHFHQRQVADGMALTVVDFLEAIQIQNQQGTLEPMPTPRIHTVFQPVQEQGAIDRKSTRLTSRPSCATRLPSSA